MADRRSTKSKERNHELIALASLLLFAIPAWADSFPTEFYGFPVYPAEWQVSGSFSGCTAPCGSFAFDMGYAIGTGAFAGAYAAFFVNLSVTGPDGITVSTPNTIVTFDGQFGGETLAVYNGAEAIVGVDLVNRLPTSP